MGGRARGGRGFFFFFCRRGKCQQERQHFGDFLHMEISLFSVFFFFFIVASPSAFPITSASQEKPSSRVQTSASEHWEPERLTHAAAAAAGAETEGGGDACSASRMPSD